MSAGVQVTGLDELQAALDTMGAELPDILKEEMTAAGEELAVAMRARAERHRFTGKTIEDIAANTERSHAYYHEVRTTVGASGEKRGRAWVLSLLEYGTSKMDPKPIVRPTADEDMPAIVERMNARIEDRVTKAGGL